jgi:phosphate transport system substrate-binding protein
MVRKGRRGGSSMGIVIAVVVIVIILAIVGVGYSQGWFKSSSSGASCSSAVTVTGAGSTFVYPMMSQWSYYYYNNEGHCVQVSYTGVGSGAGISDLTAKTVDYGASDAPLSYTQTNGLPAAAFTIPDALGAVTVIYNTDVAATGLDLTGAVVAQIFMGNITSWNASAIQSLNPSVKLPNLAITPVHRSDGSGTTFAFSSYLSDSSPTFKSVVGAGLTVNWPTSELAEKGSTGVAGTVGSTPGAVGYVELNYAVGSNAINYAAIQNPAGNFILPNVTDTEAAAAGVAPSLPAGNGNWSAVTILNQPGSGTYPIATLTYVMVYQDLGKAYGSALSLAQAQGEVKFLYWIVGSGQSYATPLSYAPLPSAITQIDYTTIAGITYNGATMSDT